MANQVFIDDDGILQHVLGADFSADTLADSHELLVPLAEKRKQSGQPLLMLVDGRAVSKVDTYTRRAALASLEAITYERIGILVGNPYMKTMANLLLKTSGRGNKAKVFDTQEQARAWLLQAIPAGRTKA